MKISLSFIFLFILIAIVAPFKLFSEQMNDYGTFLAGLAAILAVIKYALPYLLVFMYRKDYSNELILKKILNLTLDKEEGERVLETEYMLGVIEYYKRNSDEEGNSGNDSWYEHIPYLADDLFFKLDNTKMVGKKENAQFVKLKKDFYMISNIVAMGSTPANPIREDKRKELCQKFKIFTDEVKKLQGMINEVPVPVKTIIDADDFYKSFINS